MDVTIDVSGLNRIRSGFQTISDDSSDAAESATSYAANLLVSTTQPKVPYVTGAARRSIVARPSGSLARVTAGGEVAPHYAWLDFGGRAGRNLAVYRQVVREGRYLYPSLREIDPKIRARSVSVIEQVIRSAGLVAD